MSWQGKFRSASTDDFDFYKEVLDLNGFEITPGNLYIDGKGTIYVAAKEISDKERLNMVSGFVIIQEWNKEKAGGECRFKIVSEFEAPFRENCPLGIMARCTSLEAWRFYVSKKEIDNAMKWRYVSLIKTTDSEYSFMNRKRHNGVLDKTWTRSGEFAFWSEHLGLDIEHCKRLLKRGK